MPVVARDADYSSLHIIRQSQTEYGFEAALSGNRGFAVHVDGIEKADVVAAARLIAAGPELAEALRLAVQSLELKWRTSAANDVEDGGDWSPIDAKAIAKARAVLAKVEGK